MRVGVTIVTAPTDKVKPVVALFATGWRNGDGVVVVTMETAGGGAGSLPCG